ncbi:MAG: hypothetical protein JXB88_02375, partial [Spirochaetales bacterium]|nr:hypothetical protein [Spirochaetales bacterium]
IATTGRWWLCHHFTLSSLYCGKSKFLDNKIMEDIKNTVQIITEISSAISEQRGGAQEILKSMQHLVTSYQKIMEAMRNSGEESKKVNEATMKLNEFAGEILVLSNDQKEGNLEIMKSLEMLREVVGKVGEITNKMNEQITEFTVTAMAAPANQ